MPTIKKKYISRFFIYKTICQICLRPTVVTRATEGRACSHHLCLFPTLLFLVKPIAMLSIKVLGCEKKIVFLVLSFFALYCVWCDIAFQL